MTPISPIEMQSVFDIAGIEVADPKTGIGRRLSLLNGPLRTVVVHFIETDPSLYISNVLAILLSVADRWLLFPRYGAVPQLVSGVGDRESASVLFEGAEKGQLVSILTQLSDNNQLIDFDVYLLAQNGNVLAAWDHHIFHDGFCVQFQNLIQSTQFISALNDFGAEFETFYANA